MIVGRDRRGRVRAAAAGARVAGDRSGVGREGRGDRRAAASADRVAAAGLPGPRYRPSDRLVLAMLARLLPRERWSAFLVTPAPLLRWHRELVRRRWTYPQRPGGRRGLDRSVVELVLRLARENPRWGYQRITGECAKLGVAVSATSVRTILGRHPARTGPAPRRTDLDPVPAGPGGRGVGLRLPHRRDDRLGPALRLFIIELDRRRVWLAGITTNPTGPWVAQQARQLLMDMGAHAYGVPELCHVC